MAPFRKLRTKLGLRKELPTHRFGFELPEGCEVGRWTYGIEEKGLFGCNKMTPLLIGSFCSIAQNVSFLCKANHPTNFASTFPFKTEMTKTALQSSICLRMEKLLSEMMSGLDAAPQLCPTSK